MSGSHGLAMAKTATEMDLVQLLRDISITEETDTENISVISVLSEIRTRLEVSDSDKHETVNHSAAVLKRGSACWLFPEFSSNLQICYVDLITCCITYSDLPVCDADGGALPPCSYKLIPERARTVADALQALADQLADAIKLGDATSASCAKTLLKTLAPRLCIFSITHLQDQPWTDGVSRKCALKLLSSTVAATRSESLQEMLCGGMLSSILDLLQPELTKEKWKRNEALKHVFSWLLVQVGRPRLTDYLEKVFPPSLLISDDYRTENKVLGVHCLHHIIINVPAADLRQFNRAQVLYDALFNHLYTPAAPLLQVVLPCLMDLLSVLDRPLLVHAGSLRKASQFDSVLRLVLTHMEMEHKLALRRIYACNLLLFVQKMGVRIARHLKRLERVLVGYLEVSDGPDERTRLSVLEVLEVTIQSVWPRMQCRVELLAKSLLRFLVDVYSDPLDPKLKEELMGRASRCLVLLDHCSQNKLMVQLIQDWNQDALWEEMREGGRVMLSEMFCWETLPGSGCACGRRSNT